jgi:hypothetical protein
MAGGDAGVQGTWSIWIAHQLQLRCLERQHADEIGGPRRPVRELGVRPVKDDNDRRLAANADLRRAGAARTIYKFCQPGPSLINLRTRRPMICTARWRMRLASAIAVALTVAAPCATAAPSAATEIAILTPAVPALIEFRHSQAIPEPWPLAVPPISAVNILTTPIAKADTIDTRRLDTRAKADGYSPAAALSNALVAAGRATGRSVAEAPVQRGTRGGPGPIKLDELPGHSPASVLLDVSVTELKLAGGWTAHFYPTFIATYRLVDPRGGLIRPSRPLRSFYPPPTDPACPKDKTLICIERDRECQFADIADVEATAPRVWRCFDKVLQALANEIVAELPAASPSP